jgi:hypothetical protein
MDTRRGNHNSFYIDGTETAGQLWIHDGEIIIRPRQICQKEIYVNQETVDRESCRAGSMFCPGIYKLPQNNINGEYFILIYIDVSLVYYVAR